jgi:adenosylhomocysteine nucleosidase
MIALFGALRYEIVGLEKRMLVEQRWQQGNCRTMKGRYNGTDVLLVQTGPGKVNAEEAVGFVMEKRLPQALVSIGFAGGLKPGLDAGDLVLCARAYHLTPDQLLSAPLSADGKLVGLATRTLRQAALPFRQGNFLTLAHELTDPRQKASLGSQLPVDAVEMESYWLARAAARHRIPFLAVRAISDPVDQPLPQGVRLVDDRGDGRAAQVVLHALIHPGDLANLARLFAGARRARANLTAFAAAFLDAFAARQA